MASSREICRLYEEYKRHGQPKLGLGALEPPEFVSDTAAAAASEEKYASDEGKPQQLEAELASRQHQLHHHIHHHQDHKRSHKRRSTGHRRHHGKSLSSSCGSNNAMINSGSQSDVDVSQKQQQTSGSVAVLAPKDTKRALKRAAVAGLLDLLIRHERRAHARERWLMKRLKKTLGSFELSIASILARSTAAAAKGSKHTATAELGQEPPELATRDDRGRVGRPHQQQQQRGAAGNSAETGTACMQVDDSETAGGCGLVAASSKRSGLGSFAGRHQLMVAQRNCNNATSTTSTMEIGSTDDDCHMVIGCRYRSSGGGAPARSNLRRQQQQQRQPVTFCSPISTRSSSCSDDSVVTPARLEAAVYSGYNIASQKSQQQQQHQQQQQPQPRRLLLLSPFPRFPSQHDANSNHGTASSMRRQRLQQQQQQQTATSASQMTTSQLIYADSGATSPEGYQQGPQKYQQQQQQQSPPQVDIYSTPGAAAGATTSLHQAAKPATVCSQCQQATNDCGGNGGTMTQPPKLKHKKHTKQRKRQQPPRCNRCPSKPRTCPSRLRKQQVAAKKANRAARRQAKCQPGERSCGDCRPPRIHLCPADGGGAENFTRIRLQTQPGRFITRQVLFFDGSYLYQPVQPKGPCY